MRRKLLVWLLNILGAWGALTAAMLVVWTLLVIWRWFVLWLIHPGGCQ